MKFQIVGENISITESMKDFIEDNLSKTEKFFTKGEDLEARVSIKGYKQSLIKIKVNIYDGLRVIIRAEEKHKDFYAGIKKLKTKLTNQLKELRTKSYSKDKHYFKENADNEDTELTINVREKEIEKEVLDYRDAIARLEALGYDFLLFIDVDCNKPSVIYKKDKDAYGLLRFED